MTPTGDQADGLRKAVAEQMFPDMTRPIIGPEADRKLSKVEERTCLSCDQLRALVEEQRSYIAARACLADRDIVLVAECGRCGVLAASTSRHLMENNVRKHEAENVADKRHRCQVTPIAFTLAP